MSARTHLAYPYSATSTHCVFIMGAHDTSTRAYFDDEASAAHYAELMRGFNYAPWMQVL